MRRREARIRTAMGSWIEQRTKRSMCRLTCKGIGMNSGFRFGLIGLLSAVTMQAVAWDGYLTGVISAIDSVPNAGNYDFRVYLQGISGNWCGGAGAGSNGWAGLHSTDLNFKGVQATLMLAFAMNKTVSVYLTKDTAGYCKLGYVTVNQ
jgi:hypothetical protein